MAQSPKQVIYKTIDTTKLVLNFYYPENYESGHDYPAMIFYFGGGWFTGTTSQFAPHAAYFAKRGLVCVCADYRTKKKHDATPFDCLKDAKSAIRFLRSNAEKFKIDPNKIIASGGSAGGHLATACALVEGYNDTRDNVLISEKPNALVLFNPVFDNGPGGYAYQRISSSYHSFSPLHNIREGAPPTIVFLGTEDHFIQVETAKYFKMVMEKVNSRCDLFLYEGEGHGFCNKGKKHFTITLEEADKFLVSLGYLEAK
jgi:acetyl esterase/lipase